MKALLYRRRALRFGAANALSRMKPGAGAKVGPIELADVDPPRVPGVDWERVTPRLSGICGSDLATVDGRSSRYFEPLVSFPFVLGHEVVCDRADGTRAVLEPVLGPDAHGVDAADPSQADPGFSPAPADPNDYGHLLGRRLKAGLQTGFCASTGGGWSESFVAHSSQLHSLGTLGVDELSDEAAVMIEPTAAGVHAALRAARDGHLDGGTAVVVGAGTMGLAAVAGLRAFTGVDTIICAARYKHQAAFAAELGADLISPSRELARAVRRVIGGRVIGDALASGVDATIDAVGNAETLTAALGVTRPRGTVVVLGMPGDVKLNLTALWHRETTLVGAYCYGSEPQADGEHTFALATQLVRDRRLERLVSATYPLEQYEDALTHAAEAGTRGAIKIAFDLR